MAYGLGDCMLVEEYVGYCIKNPHNGSDIYPERHISAGIVLPSTSMSFLSELASFWKNKIFFRSQAIITWYVSYGWLKS